jgi:hypothetical protein
MKYSKKIYENEDQDQGQKQAQGQAQSDEKVKMAKELIKTERNLGTFINKFGSIANDPKVQRFLEAAGDLDKIVSKEVPGIPAISLIPSQQEVGLGNSVADLILNPGWDSTGEKTDNELNLILSDSPVRLTDKNGNLIVVAKCPGTTSDEDKYWVIDGHHRWSKAAVANPNVKLTCMVFEPTENSGLDIIGVLKAFHIANFKIKKQSPTEPLSGANLLACDDNEIIKFLDTPQKFVMDDKGNKYPEKSDNKLKIWKEKKGVEDWNGVTKLLLENRKKLAEARNNAPIDKNSTPTPRNVMPQVADPKATATEFSTPKINVVISESRVIKSYQKFFENWKNK